MSAKRKSWKRTDTSSTSPPDRPPLFIDRNAWSRRLGAALGDAGVAFVAHHQQFSSESPDEDWIAAASRNNWIAITRDQNIRRKPNELAAIRGSRAIIFVFTSGNLSAESTARILVAALPRIFQLALDTPRPALYSIHLDSRIVKLAF